MKREYLPAPKNFSFWKTTYCSGFTGHFITEPSLQTSTGWFRLGTDNFWTDALAAAGISPAQLPELQECGSRAGFLTEEAAQQLGLPAGLPVLPEPWTKLQPHWLQAVETALSPRPPEPRWLPQL